MKFFLVWGLILFNTLLQGQTDKADSLWVATQVVKTEYQIPMRDGVKLFTSVYEPQTQQQEHPILFVRTPYSCAPYGAAIAPRMYKSYWLSYLRDGYIIVMQDVRGCYMSEGEFTDVKPLRANTVSKTETDESTDAYDSIDWLIRHLKNSNGKVGVFGISYPGFYATMTAACGHPALKAASPQAPVTDWFMGDDFHHNGAFALMDGFSFFSSFGKPRPFPRKTGKPGYVFTDSDNYHFYLNRGPVKQFMPLMDSIAFWKQVVQHPDYDDWWKARDARRAAPFIKIPILIVGGTFDAEDCFGAWNLYKACKRSNAAKTKNPVHLVMGPWYHGGWSRGTGAFLGSVRFGAKTSWYYQQVIEKPFFDRYLKSTWVKDSEPSQTHVFFTGSNCWRHDNQWPPNSLFWTPFALQTVREPNVPNALKGNRNLYVSDPLSPVPYADGIHLNRTREYMIDDQRFAVRRPDVLTYASSTLTDSVTWAGPVYAKLWIKTTCSDCDMVVKIIDVFPEQFSYDTSYCCDPKVNAHLGGYQMLVRGEIMRTKYRNSFSNPEPLKVDSANYVEFTLPDVAHTFLKGHKIMIQIQSSWFPLFDRNPQTFTNIYTCDESAFKPCTIQLLETEPHKSYIQVPVLKNP